MPVCILKEHDQSFQKEGACGRGLEIMDAHAPCSGLYACRLLLAGRAATRRGKEVWLPVVASLFPTAGRFPVVCLGITASNA